MNSEENYKMYCINYYSEKKPYDIVYGIQKTSFNDYESNMCTVLFTGGCNLRCPYCHNMDSLVNCYDFLPIDTDKSLIPWLKQRYEKGILTHLTITGGEPTIHGDGLIELIQKIKYEVSDKIKIKLDTNGTNPSLLKSLITKYKFIDYVAMDIKSTETQFFKFCRYVTSYLTAHETPEALYEKTELSIKILYENYIHKLIDGLEFRTTIFKDNYKENMDISELSEEFGKMFIDLCELPYKDTAMENSMKYKTPILYYIQNYKIPEWKSNQGIENETDLMHPLSEDELSEYLHQCMRKFPKNVKPIIRR